MKYAYLLLAVGLVACSHDKKSAGEAGEALPVEVTAVTTDSVTLYKTYPGMLNAQDEADVVCRINGTMLTQNYQDGAHVTKGQLLFTIDPSTYQNNLAEAEATLATARSNNEYAEAHYTAVERASASNAVSQMEVAQALSDRDQSRASIKNAEAALAQARQDLAKCTIRAPFTGLITASIYSPGAYIAGEASPVKMAHIYEDKNLAAVFNIEDESFLRMFENPNNRHLINYDAIPIEFGESLPHTYTGKMYYISPGVDSSTGTLLLKCAVQNDYGELKPGMFVTVKLPYRVEPQAMLVRDASISTDQLGKYLWVVNDSNKVVYTPIQVGDLANDSMRVVNSGLKPGDRYVTSALLKMRDGITVKPY